MSSPFVDFVKKREEYRQKMREAKDPKEAAEQKRLFRNARNQVDLIERRK